MSPLYMGTPFYYCGRPSNTPVIASSSVLCHFPVSPHREGSRRLPDHWPDAQEYCEHPQLQASHVACQAGVEWSAWASVRKEWCRGAT